MVQQDRSGIQGHMEIVMPFSSDPQSCLPAISAVSALGAPNCCHCPCDNPFPMISYPFLPLFLSPSIMYGSSWGYIVFFCNIKAYSIVYIDPLRAAASFFTDISYLFQHSQLRLSWLKATPHQNMCIEPFKSLKRWFIPFRSRSHPGRRGLRIVGSTHTQEESWI